MDFSMGTYTLERNDDLLTEILLHLPSKSIFKFTCVSTRWNNLITYRSFRKLYSVRTRRSLTCSNPKGRLLGLVQCNTKFGCCIQNPLQAEHSFMPVHGEEYVPAGACGGGYIPVECSYFITSSKDGLILCGRIPDMYCVGDPTTGRWETLPPPPPPEGFPKNCLSVGLSSNEEDDALGGKIINFQVIVASGCENAEMQHKLPGRKVIPIETYSSRTREWRISRLMFEVPVKIKHAEPPSFSGGFFHWLTSDTKNIVAYDPSSLDEEGEGHENRGLVPKKRRKKNKKKREHVVQVINTPLDVGFGIVWRSGNGQTMWYATSNVRDGLFVFRKRDESDAWTCISRVASMDVVRKDILGLTPKDIELEVALNGGLCERELDDRRPHRVMVWMIAFIPWDPKLILIRYGDRIYIYNCIRKKLDHEVMLDGDRRFTEQSWEWYPYFHSLSNSPCNLKYHHQP